MPNNKAAKRRTRERARRDQLRAVSELERMRLNFIRWASIPSELETVSALVPGALDNLEMLRDVHRVIHTAADGVETLVSEIDKLVEYVKALSALEFVEKISEIQCRSNMAVSVAKMADTLLSNAEMALSKFQVDMADTPVQTTVYHCAVAHHVAMTVYCEIRVRLEKAKKENRLVDAVVKHAKELWYLLVNALAARALYRMWLQPPLTPTVDTIRMMRELDILVLNTKAWVRLNPTPPTFETEWPHEFARRHVVWYNGKITPIAAFTLSTDEIKERYGVEAVELSDLLDPSGPSGPAQP